MKRRLHSILLTALSAVLFALSFPNPLTGGGIWPLAFVFALPILALEAPPGEAFIQGLAFGALAFGLSNFWLYSYDPLAILVVVIPMALWHGLLFALLSFFRARSLYLGGALSVFAWVAFEYARTLGVFGYPFGIIAYSQYRFTALIQLASITGVWGVSLLVMAPQFFIAASLTGAGAAPRPRIGLSAAARALPALAALLFAVAWGGLSLSGHSESSAARMLRVALIQANIQGADGSVDSYSQGFEVLKGLSTKALAESPDLVVWPETAFVPSIVWHRNYRTDEAIYQIVSRCLAFIRDSNTDFLIGNNQGERAAPGSEERIDFNAVLSLPRGQDGIFVYRKVHLVPFSEYFPYRRELPGLYAFLVEREGNFWRPGASLQPLPTNAGQMATPICFEDGFGDLVRRLAGPGVSLIVSVVNDAWSKSESAERQHLAFSVFRAVENGKAVARCANSGITCTVDARGRIGNIQKPFSRSFVVAPVDASLRDPTPYSRWGDWFAILCLLGTALGFLACLIAGAVSRFRRAGLR